MTLRRSVTWALFLGKLQKKCIIYYQNIFFCSKLFDAKVRRTKSFLSLNLPASIFSRAKRFATDTEQLVAHRRDGLRVWTFFPLVHVIANKYIITFTTLINI